jgi:hypothetical protein
MEKPLKRQGYVITKIGRRKGNKKQYREWAENILLKTSNNG